MAISEGERKLREMQIKTRLINEAIKKEQIKIQAAANYYSQSNAMSVKEKTQKIVEITQESYNWMVEKEQQLEKAEQECNKIVQSLVNDMAKVSAIENVTFAVSTLPVIRIIVLIFFYLRIISALFGISPKIIRVLYTVIAPGL